MKCQGSPSLYVAPKFGWRQPQMTNIDTTDPMTAKQKLQLQRIVGTLLYYARAIYDIKGHGLKLALDPKVQQVVSSILIITAKLSSIVQSYIYQPSQNMSWLLPLRQKLKL